MTENHEWTVLRQSDDRRWIAELSLVLTATYIENRVLLESGLWCLYVRAENVDAARDQLERYRIENRPGAGRIAPPATVDSGWAGVGAYLMVIWAVWFLEGSLRYDWGWRTAGALDAGQVMAGQWWRTITALTLHADIGHIASNSAFGAFFGLFVGRYLGSGLGWALVLASAATGNAVNALLRPDEFRAIGASTATFAAVGLSAAFIWRSGYYRRDHWKRSLAPIIAAIGLLAFTGMGGENTDVLGHCLGFAAGIGFGVAASHVDVRRFEVPHQWVVGAAAMAVVAGSWMLAAAAFAQPAYQYP